MQEGQNHAKDVIVAELELKHIKIGWLKIEKYEHKVNKIQ